MKIETVVKTIGHRIVGTGIFCIYGIEHLNDSIIEIIQDYMKDRKEKQSIISIYDKSEFSIHYCGEDRISDIDDFDSETIMIFSSFEEFAHLNDIDDKFKNLDDINEADRKYLRKHNNGYISETI